MNLVFLAAPAAIAVPVIIVVILLIIVIANILKTEEMEGI